MTHTNGDNIAVRLRDVTKTFGSGGGAVRALRGVDLEIEAGRLIVLAGPSGCGKTTLLSIISGMLTPTAGEVEVFGVDWRALPEDQKAIRRGEMVGYMFQRFHLIPTLPIIVNVAVPLLARGVPMRTARARAGRALGEVGLGDRPDALPGELSGGMLQRAALARALVSEPRLLVCDEPTANLDSQTGAAVMNLIHAASHSADGAGRRRSVIVVTHDEAAMRLADEIHRMADGKVAPETVGASLLEGQAVG